MNGEERKVLLLAAGVKLAVKFGAENVTRRDIAKAAKVSEPLVTRYLGSKSEIPKAIIKAAKKAGETLPDKSQSKVLGEKLRKATRQQAAKKTMAKRQAGPLPAKAGAVKKSSVSRTAGVRTASPAKPAVALPADPVKKTAARRPKAIPKIVIPTLDA